MATIGRNKAVVDVRKFHFKGLFAWAMWMMVHLFSLAGFRNRLVVFINWCWSYFTYDKGTRLIIRPFKGRTLRSDVSKEAEQPDSPQGGLEPADEASDARMPKADARENPESPKAEDSGLTEIPRNEALPEKEQHVKEQTREAEGETAPNPEKRDVELVH